MKSIATNNREHLYDFRGTVDSVCHPQPTDALKAAPFTVPASNTRALHRVFGQIGDSGT